MKGIIRKTTLGLFSIGLLGGCDGIGADDFNPEVAVSAVLIAGELLPPVTLARTGSINQPYDPDERAINDAQVSLQLVETNGNVVSLPYVITGNRPGEYGFVSPEDSVRVEGGATYRFEATVPGFTDPVRAETTVPEVFAVARPLPDTLFYQIGPSPVLDLTPTSYPGRQSIYVFNVRAMEPETYPLTPFANDLVNDFDVDPEDLYASSSPLLNEENFTVNPDGTIEIGVVWLSFNFYGPQQLVITAVDDALVDFLQSQVIQFIPTTLSPGEIPNVVSNVENGVGVFGAVAQATTFTFLAPEP